MNGSMPILFLSHLLLISLLTVLSWYYTKQSIMQRLELIMGRNIPDNGRVTDPMMNSFIKEYIIPFFEYGTFIDGEGLWKGELEQTKIFYLELPDSEVDEIREMFQKIAIKYKQAFNQDSVLISQIDSKIAFV
tara:strand:+ start:137 stop:535 length:399 start_codon:yes stop_codon:yes gene_type:complete